MDGSEGSGEELWAGQLEQVVVRCCVEWTGHEGESWRRRWPGRALKGKCRMGVLVLWTDVVVPWTDVMVLWTDFVVVLWTDFVVLWTDVVMVL